MARVGVVFVGKPPPWCRISPLRSETIRHMRRCSCHGAFPPEGLSATTIHWWVTAILSLVPLKVMLWGCTRNARATAAIAAECSIPHFRSTQRTNSAPPPPPLLLLLQLSLLPFSSETTTAADWEGLPRLRGVSSSRRLWLR